MERFLILVLTCISTIPVFAQPSYPGFLFDKFEKGRVLYQKGGQVSDGRFNYDTVGEKVLFVVQDTVILELDRTDIVSELRILDRVFEHAGNGVFYERIQTGSDCLYVRWNTRLVYEEKEGAYGTRPGTGAIDHVNQISSMGSLYQLRVDNNYRMIPENVYYLKNKKEFKRFSSFDSLAKQFRSCRDQVKSYIKNENLDFKVPDDIVKAVTYCFDTCK